MAEGGGMRRIFAILWFTAGAVTCWDGAASAQGAGRQTACAQALRAGRDLPRWCGGREGALAPPFDRACDDRQWVGLRLDAIACPDAPSATGTWHVSEPFARSRDARLRRVCQYTWQPALRERATPDVAALPDRPDLRLERDCDVVGAHALPTEVTDALQAAWSGQVEQPDWSAAAPFALAPTEVAVIDGGYGGLDFGGNVPATVVHAVAVSSVIRAIACPGAGDGPFCAVGTPNYPAMQYVLRGLPGEIGGYFGTQLEYAAQVAAAVDDWQALAPATRARHLVLNLSLGWDGAYDVTRAGRVPGAVALWATRYAACEGALLIAAAGNRAADSDTGPLFPAGWETLPRDCDGAPARGRVYSPLVHAVGGVDGRDAPLGIARDGATPRLVAPAAAVVVTADTVLEDDGPTAPLSGTSMAAAAASGTAALVWSLRPGLSADQVMEAVYLAGEPLGQPADFGLPGPPQGQRRLSVARAFALACPEAAAGGACPPAASRPALPAPRPAGADATAPFDDLVAALFAGAEEGQADPGAADPPAAPTQSFEPFTVPQPGSPNCPICGFIDTSLYVKLDDALAGYALGTPIVHTWRFDSTWVDIKLTPLQVGTSFLFNLSTPLGGKSPKAAWLQIPVTNEKGTTVLTSSELFVK
jgi:hypothetical protein